MTLQNKLIVQSPHFLLCLAIGVVWPQPAASSLASSMALHSPQSAGQCF